MSREAPDSLRERADDLVRAVNAGDFDAIARMDWLDPAFEFHSALSAAEGQYHVGAAGLEEWKASMESVWTDFRIEIVDFRELRDGRVLVTFHATGRARGSGMPLDMRTAQIWTLRDGKLWHNQSYTDVREAFEAAGLGE